MVNEGGVGLEIKLIYFVFDLVLNLHTNYRVGIRADFIQTLFKVFGALFDLIS